MAPDSAPQNNGKTSDSKSLHLTLPDWRDLDTLRCDDLPFALWSVGPQPLLFHWFDYAHNQRYRDVVLYCADRAERIRAAIREATLWPLRIELVPVADEGDGKGIRITGLPESFPNRINGSTSPGEEWDLIDYWFALERDWHDFQSAHVDRNVSHENVGTGCLIDPTAFVREPVQIGNHVFIGPGCHIGPYANIGDGCLIEGHSTIEQARLAPDTFLSAHTELKHVLLDSGRLFNLKHRAVIESLDDLVWAGPKPERQVKTGFGQDGRQFRYPGGKTSLPEGGRPLIEPTAAKERASVHEPGLAAPSNQ